ncbi:MAG: hypothetical protein AB8B88_10455 [Devosiaceae bacterium]
MMAQQLSETDNVAPPSAQRVTKSQSEPLLLDLVHLSCQTFGDAALEMEVLRLFLGQAESTSSALRCTSDGTERARLYHLIKGSARGVGAFELSELAQAGEDDPASAKNLDATLDGIERVMARVDALLGTD